jgi:hypothetical protein
MNAIKIIDENFNFEVASEDLPDKYNWYKAIEEVKKIGNGWRLPTKEELKILYKRKDGIGDFASDYYWSSSEVNSYYAWYQYFNIGYQYYYYNKYLKYFNFRVRAVRDIL